MKFPPSLNGLFFSIADRAPVCLAALLALTSAPICAIAAMPPISVSIESIEYGDVRLQGVRAVISKDDSFELRVTELSLEGTGRLFDGARLNCPDWRQGSKGWCDGGSWQAVAAAAMPEISGALGSFAYEGDTLAIESSVVAGGLEAALSLIHSDGETRAELTWDGQPISGLPALFRTVPQLEWAYAGETGGSAELLIPAAGEPRVRYGIRVGGLGFDSPEGRFAGDSLALEAEGAITAEPGLSVAMNGSVESGELLLDDFYRDFSDGALAFSTQMLLEDSVLNLAGFRLSDGVSLTLEGNARFGISDAPEPAALRISLLELSFPLAYERYIESTASIWTLDGLATSGTLNWSGQWRGAGEDRTFQSGVLNVSDLTVVDGKRGRFAISGLDAHLRPGDHDYSSRLSWDGSLFHRINFGAGEAALKSAPDSMDLAGPLVLDVLGGTLTVHELGVSLPEGGQPDVRLRAGLEGLDMALLTAAMDWPSFSGEISGSVPGVNLRDGVLSVDGGIDISVFDGAVVLTDLSVERPFGVLPSLAANVEITNLDLEQLTSTFSFGQISGRLDGYVRDLRMLDWKPVAFDAWLGTPERQEGSNDISRQAVNHLTTIGGGSATAALTGPVLRLFNNFSYRRLGLGCRLRNNVCDVRGLSDDDVSVLILEGSGIPKIMIRAFNRKMDWPQLVADLLAVSGQDSIKVGD